MRDGFSSARIVHLVTRAKRRRPRGSRQIWLVVLALAIAICAEAIVIPARRSARLATLSRDDIPADVIGLVAAGKKIQAIN